MSLFTIFKIANQGMSAQRQRLEAASANLANANSTRTESGLPYQRRDVIFKTQDATDSWRKAALGSGIFDRGADYETVNQGVSSEVVLADANQFVLTYQPGHPDADAAGYVKMPDVDPLEETVNMLSAARSFEANSTVFNTAKDLAKMSINLAD